VRCIPAPSILASTANVGGGEIPACYVVNSAQQHFIKESPMDYLELLFADKMRARAVLIQHADFCQFSDLSNPKDGISGQQKQDWFESNPINKYVEQACNEVKYIDDMIKNLPK
jgi:hypothetical protein